MAICSVPSYTIMDSIGFWTLVLRFVVVATLSLSPIPNATLLEDCSHMGCSIGFRLLSLWS